MMTCAKLNGNHFAAFAKAKAYVNGITACNITGITACKLHYRHYRLMHVHANSPEQQGEGCE